MRYESDSETEELQITKHLHIGSIELHLQPDITTYNLEDVESDTELEHSLTTHSDEQSQPDKEPVISSIVLQYFIPQSGDEHSVIDYTPQSDDKHSIIDYQCTPMSTAHPPHINAVITPPTSHLRHPICDQYHFQDHQRS